MSRLLPGLFSVLLLASSAWAVPPPVSPRGDHVDVLHGVSVPDPYRWLEDNDAPATREWVAAQNAYSLPQLAALPSRARFQTRLTELWNFPRQGVPETVAGHRFYERNDGLQNQAVLWVEAPGRPTRVLLDPNTLSADGTVALTQWKVSPDGRTLAYALARAGSDWNEIRFRDVASGEDLPEVLGRIKFSAIAWAGDSSGVFYSRYPEAPEDAAPGVFDDLANQALYFHPIGGEPAEDWLVHADPEQPRHGFIGEVSEDGRFLVVSVWQGAASENAVKVYRLGEGEPAWADGPLTLVPDFRAQYRFLGNHGERLYFLTTDGAPRGRVVVADLAARTPTFREVVGQGPEPLQDAALSRGHLVLLSLRDASHRLSALRLADGARREIALPGLGTVSGLRARQAAEDLHFALTAFNRPATVYRLDLAQPVPRLETVFAPPLRFDPEDYVTEQVFVTSRDGTRVPVFLSHRKDLDRSRPQRVHLYGYGGFDISLTPSFSVSALAWMEAGGVYAVANLRGGGEYGRDWHQAGTRERKQNVFDDFVAAAGHLIARGWTTPRQLAISGRSNGGLLVGAVLNQHPQLFGAAMAGVGVMDMLRFHRFTIGWAWTGDYGDPDDPAMFPHLLAYSPYHNVRKGAHYPAVLITTADHDDRVVPAHSYKYAAALQWAQGGSAPILIRIDTQAGHGAGKPLAMVIEEAADVLAFLFDHTAVQD